MVKRRLTRFQVWEIIIVVLFILFMTYRMALVYDYIPKEYQPSVLFDDVYVRVKKDLQDESTQQSSFGRAAAWSLDRVNSVETYFKEKEERYKRAKEVSERCQENMLFRFFMFMGEEENNECAERNLTLKKQTEEIFNDTKRPKQGDEQKNNNTYTTPSAIRKTPPANVVTPPAPQAAPQTINMQGRTTLTPETVTPQPAPIAVPPAPVSPPVPVAAPVPEPQYVPAPQPAAIGPPVTQPVAASPRPVGSPGAGGRQPISVTEPE